MRAHILASALAFAMLASGCSLTSDDTDEVAANDTKAEEATDISINLGDEDGKIAIRSDGSDKNRVNLKLPGIDINVKVPNIDIKADDVDIGGVDMYPGTKLKSFNIDAGKSSGNEKALVRVGMTFPATAASVADYYEGAMKQKDVTYTRNGGNFTGTTDDGDRFTLAIADAGKTSTGELTIHEAK